MASPPTVELDWGRVDPAVLSRIAVVSPHFDDAAMGAGHVLTSYPGSTVITVLGGRPPGYPAEPTPWDASGGFVAGDDVVAARRDEDLEAMTVLGAAEPIWLEFADHQYLEPEHRPRPDQVAPDLAVALRSLDPTAVFMPMGLANPDHVLTHSAGLIVRAEGLGKGQAPTWFCYEDQGYKHIPGMLAWRVATLFKSGIWPTPAMVPVELDLERKAAGIACYRSQIAPLEGEHALSERMGGNVPEQYWRLAPPPPGWERMIDSI